MHKKGSRMAHPRHSERNAPSSANYMNKTEKLFFTDVTTIARTTSSGYEISEIDLTIASFSGSSRVGALAPFYEYYRFNHLYIEAYIPVNPVSAINSTPSTFYVEASCGLGFMPSAAADFASATSYNDLMQYPESRMGMAGKKLSLKLNSKQLVASTPTKWYHTKTTGTPPAADSSAGVITWITRLGVAVTTAYNSYVIIRGEIEFKGPLIGTASFQYQPLPCNPVRKFVLGEDSQRIVVADESKNEIGFDDAVPVGDAEVSIFSSASACKPL